VEIKSRYFKSFVCLTLFIYSWSCVSWAEGIGSTITILKDSRQIQNLKLSASASPSIQSLKLPARLGQIKSKYYGSSDEVLIHIQDAHANEEAQLRIAEILQTLNEQLGLQTVALEGGEGELNSELFSFIPDSEARRQVSEYMLKNGRLTGAEYLTVVKKPNLKLYGIENWSLYKKNRALYLEIMKRQKDDLEILGQLENIFSKLIRYVFSEPMRELYANRTGVYETGQNLFQYARYLTRSAGQYQISLKDFPRLQKLKSLAKYESETNLSEAESGIQGFIGDLRKDLSPDQRSRFIQQTALFRTESLPPDEYYAYLIDETEKLASAHKSKFSRKHAAVLRYLRFVTESAGFGSSVFDEMERLENRVKEKCLRGEDEKRMDRLMRILEVYLKMFRLALTKKDAEFFYRFREEFQTREFDSFLRPILKKHRFEYKIPEALAILDRDLPRVERFYQLAVERDQVMADNTVLLMKEKKQKFTALITGGFHTPGIEKYMKDRKYSFIVITPRMTQATEEKRAAEIYQNAMEQKILPAEHFLAQVFLSLKTKETLENPAFQLVPELLLPPLNQGWSALETKLPAAAYFSLLVHWDRFLNRRSEPSAVLKALPAGMNEQGLSFFTRRIRSLYARSQLKGNQLIYREDSGDNYTVLEKIQSGKQHGRRFWGGRVAEKISFGKSGLSIVRGVPGDLLDYTPKVKDFQLMRSEVRMRDPFPREIELLEPRRYLSAASLTTPVAAEVRIISPETVEVGRLTAPAMAMDQKQLSLTADESEAPIKLGNNGESRRAEASLENTPPSFEPAAILYPLRGAQLRVEVSGNVVVTKNSSGQITQMEVSHVLEGKTIREVSVYSYDPWTGLLKGKVMNRFLQSEGSAEVLLESQKGHYLTDAAGQVMGIAGGGTYRGFYFKISETYEFDKLGGRLIKAVRQRIDPTGRYEPAVETMSYEYGPESITEKVTRINPWNMSDVKDALYEERVIEIPDARNHPLHIPKQTKIFENESGNPRVILITYSVQEKAESGGGSKRDQSQSSMGGTSSSSQKEGKDNQGVRAAVIASGAPVRKPEVLSRKEPAHDEPQYGSNQDLPPFDESLARPEPEPVLEPGAIDPAISYPVPTAAAKMSRREQRTLLDQVAEELQDDFQRMVEIVADIKRQLQAVQQEEPLSAESDEPPSVSQQPLWRSLLAVFFALITLSFLIKKFKKDRKPPSVHRDEAAVEEQKELRRTAQPLEEGLSPRVLEKLGERRSVKRPGGAAGASRHESEKKGNWLSVIRHFFLALLVGGLVFSASYAAGQQPAPGAKIEGVFPVHRELVQPYSGRDGQKGFAVNSPISGTFKLSEGMTEILNTLKVRGERPNMLAVKKGTLIGRVTDEELERLINHVDRQRAQAEDHYARYQKLAKEYRDPADFQGMGQRVFNLRLARVQLEYTRRALSSITAPADGYIEMETLADDGIISANTRVFRFTPADRFKVRIEVSLDRYKAEVLPSQFDFLFQVRDSGEKLHPVNIQQITVENFEDPVVHLNFDLFMPNSLGGLPSHVEWQIRAPRDPVPQIRYSTGKELSVNGKVSIRPRFAVAAPPIPGPWTPTVIDLSRVTKGSPVGGVSSLEYLLSGLEEMKEYAKQSDWWLAYHSPSSVAEGQKRGVAFIWGDKGSDKLLWDMFQSRSEIKKLEERKAMAGSRAAHSGRYIPLPEVIGQPVLPGGVVGHILSDSVRLENIEVPKKVDGSSPLEIGDVVIITAPQGEFLGQIQGLNPHPPNLNGQDKSGVILLTDVLVRSDPNFRLGDGMNVTVLIPRREEQEALKAKLVSDAADTENKTAAPVPVVYKDAVLPDLIQNWLQTGSQPGENANQQRNQLLRFILSESVPHRRISAAQYFMSHFHTDKEFHRYLSQMILQDQGAAGVFRSDVAQIALNYLKDRGQILSLLEIHEAARKQPRLAFSAGLAAQFIQELIETHEGVLPILVQHGRGNPAFRAISQNFFLSLITMRVEASDWNNPVLLQILRQEDFWTNEELALLSLSPNLSQETVTILSREAQRRIAELKARDTRLGFPYQALKKEMSYFVFPHLHDGVHMVELDMDEDLRFLTQSLQWMAWAKFVDPDLERSAMEGFRALTAQADKQNPPRIEAYDMAYAKGKMQTDPLFTSLDFKAQTAVLDSLNKDKKWGDLGRLLFVPKIRHTHGGKIIDFLNEHHEGRYWIANIYHDLASNGQQDLDFLHLIEQKDFFNRIVEDLWRDRHMETRAVVPLGRKLADNSVITGALIRRYQRAQGPNEETERKFILAALLRFLPSRYEIGDLAGAGEGTLWKQLQAAGGSRGMVRTAAEDEAERRAWLLSILMARSQFGLRNLNVVIPGLEDLTFQNIEQLLSRRQFHNVSFEDRLKQAVADGSVSQGHYDHILQNKQKVKSRMIEGERFQMTFWEILFWRALPLLTALGFLFVLGGIRVTAAFISRAAKKIRWLYSYSNDQSARQQVSRLSQEEDLAELGNNYRDAAETLQKPQLEREDISMLLNFTKQILNEGFVFSTKDAKPETVHKLDEILKRGGELSDGDIQAKGKDLFVLTKLIIAAIQRLEIQTESILAGIESKEGFERASLEIKAAEAISAIHQFIETGSASEDFRYAMGMAHGLKNTESYWLTVTGTWANSTANFIYWLARWPILYQPGASFVGKPRFIKAIRSFLKRMDSLEPGRHGEKTLKGIQALMPDLFIPRTDTHGRYRMRSEFEVRNFVSRTLVSLAIFLTLIAPLLSWGLQSAGVPAVINFFSFSLAAFGAVVSYWLHWRTILRGWRVPEYFVNQSKLGYARRKFLSLSRQLSDLTGETVIADEASGTQSALLLGAHRLFKILERELKGEKNTDAVIVVLSPGETNEPDLQSRIQRLLNPYKRGDVPLIFVPAEGAGSGTAYISGRNYFQKNYNRIRNEFSGLPGRFQQTRTIYLVVQKDNVDPLAMQLALMNGYQANQELGKDDAERKYRRMNEVVLSANAGYAGPILPRGDITLMGAFQSGEKIKELRSGVIDTPYEKELQWFLQRPSPETLADHVKRPRFTRYVDSENQKVRQYSAFANIMLVSFDPVKDPVRYRGYERLLEALHNKMQPIYNRHGVSFYMGLVEDIVIPAMIAIQPVSGGTENEEESVGGRNAEGFDAGQNQWIHRRKRMQAYFAARTEGKNRALKAAYQTLYDQFYGDGDEENQYDLKDAKIAQFTPHTSQAMILDAEGRQDLKEIMERDIGSEARSEVRRAPNVNLTSLQQAAVISGLAAADQMKFESNPKMWGGSEKRASGKFTETLLRTVERIVPEAAALKYPNNSFEMPLENGDYLFQYNPLRHSPTLVRRLAQKIPKQVKLILFVDSGLPLAERRRLYARMAEIFKTERGQQKMIIPRFDAPKWSAEDFIKVQLRARRLGEDSLFYISEKGMPAELLKMDYREAVYAGAIPLARNYLVLVGREEKIPGTQELTLLEIFAAVRAVESSA